MLKTGPGACKASPPCTCSSSRSCPKKAPCHHGLHTGASWSSGLSCCPEDRLLSVRTALGQGHDASLASDSLTQATPNKHRHAHARALFLDRSSFPSLVPCCRSKVGLGGVGRVTLSTGGQVSASPSGVQTAAAQSSHRPWAHPSPVPRQHCGLPSSFLTKLAPQGTGTSEVRIYSLH